MSGHEWLTALDRIGFQSMRVLLSVLWQSSILLIATVILSHLLRRRRASARCAIWATVILAAPLLPLLNWAVLTSGLPQAPIPVVTTYSPPEVDMTSVQTPPEFEPVRPQPWPAAGPPAPQVTDTNEEVVEK